MASRVFNNALQEFIATTGDVRAFVKFVSAANRVRPWVQQMVEFENLQAEHKSALVGFVSRKDYHVETGCNGVLLLLAGGFEQFVRRLVRDSVLWINRSYQSYEKLKKELCNENLLRSGHALVSINSPRVEFGYDYESICRNLGTCCNGGGKLVLNADAFAAHITNITPDRINEALGRIGVAIDWDVFGRDPEIQRAFGLTKVRETANQLDSWLRSFIDQRNLLAHTGAGGIQVSEREIEKALCVLAALAPALAKAVEAKL